MQALQLRVWSKNNCGKNISKLDMTSQENNLCKWSGIGRMSMAEKLLISLKDMEYLLTGIDLPLHSMNRDQLQSKNLSVACMKKD